MREQMTMLHKLVESRHADKERVPAIPTTSESDASW